MKTMKTCKVGCGKMKAGGPIKKLKKMAPGGPTGYNYGIPLNGLPMRPTNGNTDISKNQMGTNPTMRKGGIAKMKKSMKKYQPGGQTGENPNPTSKSVGKQAAVFGGALAALVAATREKGVERRAKKAEERYDKRQVKKQAKLEAKNTPKSRMGGMTKSKKK